MQQFDFPLVSGKVVGALKPSLTGRTNRANVASAAEPAVGVGGEPVTDAAGKSRLDILFGDIRAQAGAAVFHAFDRIGEIDLRCDFPKGTIALKLGLSGGDLSGLPRRADGQRPCQCSAALVQSFHHGPRTTQLIGITRSELGRHEIRSSPELFARAGKHTWALTMKAPTTRGHATRRLSPTTSSPISSSTSASGPARSQSARSACRDGSGLRSDEALVQPIVIGR